MDHRNCSYELFYLITEKNRSEATTKTFVLKHTILYVHCVDLLMWSPTKLDFPFINFLWFIMIFQRFSRNKYKKDKIALKTVYNRASEVRWIVLKVDGGVLPGFGVQGGKADFHESWGKIYNYAIHDPMSMKFLQQFNHAIFSPL